jgi:hypothetical protein
LEIELRGGAVSFVAVEDEVVGAVRNEGGGLEEEWKVRECEGLLDTAGGALRVEASHAKGQEEVALLHNIDRYIQLDELAPDYT